MLRKKALLGAVMLLGLAAGQANASTYSWSFGCDVASDCSGSGTLETNQPIVPGTLITAVTGTFSTALFGAQSIISLSAPLTFGNNDNKINSVTNPELGSAGFAFSTTAPSGFLYVNLFNNDLGSGDAVWLAACPNCSVLLFKVGTFSVTPASPVPIPAALPLFAAGLGAMGLMSRRKKRKAVVAG